jgi:hypothetical protein
MKWYIFKLIFTNRDNLIYVLHCFQAQDDVRDILNNAPGIQCVISKPLRLVIPKNTISKACFDEMKPFYEGGGENVVLWYSKRNVYSEERCASEIKSLHEECDRRGITLPHCIKNGSDWWSWSPDDPEISYSTSAPWLTGIRSSFFS